MPICSMSSITEETKDSKFFSKDLEEAVRAAATCSLDFSKAATNWSKDGEAKALEGELRFSTSFEPNVLTELTFSFSMVVQI